MPVWKRTIILANTWAKVQEEELPLSALVTELTEKLKKLRPLPYPSINEELKELIQELEEFTSDDSDDFDELMSRIWDWGDQRVGFAKNCFIQVFGD
jgi:hypothetical protein